MEIVRTTSYAASLKRLAKRGATQADILAMEDAIAQSPEAGAVIPGTGGLRKARFGFAGGGKRGGGRTIYYVLLSDETIYLLASYAKSDRDDLSSAEKKLFTALVKELTND